MKMESLPESSAAVDNLCNFLSLTCIITCLILKLPQMISILKAGNTKSLSLTSVLLEECGYSIILSYNFAMGYPLPTYFEYTFLVLQDLVLIILMLHYNDMLRVSALFYFIICFVVYCCLAYRVFPAVVLTLSVAGVTPISIGSKGSQILTLYRNKAPGQVSLVTWAIAFYGCCVRMLTTALQTADVVVFVSFFVSAALNATVIIMIIYYKRQQKQKLY